MTEGFLPAWKGVFEQWSRSYVRENFWRIRHLMDKDDALQECGCCFAYCTQKYAQAYGGRCDNPAWFMALYKLKVSCHFSDLAVQDTHQRQVSVMLDESPKQEPAEEGLGFICAMLSEASEELKKVLFVIGNSPSEFVGIMLKETEQTRWSRRLCRMSQTANKDVVGELRAILMNEK